MDEEGRYCLNDIHKFAGGEIKDRPAEWLKISSTAGLAAELDLEGIPSISAKRGAGTYVCKELVYAYAMWISPSFHLKVIRAFDRLQTRGVAVADHAAADLRKNPLKYMRELLEQAEMLEQQLAIAQPKADAFDANCAVKGETLARFIRSLPGVNSQQIKRDLARLGFLYKSGGSYRVYSQHRDTLFTEKVNPYSSRGEYDIYPTAEGKQKLVQTTLNDLKLIDRSMVTGCVKGPFRSPPSSKSRQPATGSALEENLSCPQSSS